MSGCRAGTEAGGVGSGFKAAYRSLIQIHLREDDFFELRLLGQMLETGSHLHASVVLCLRRRVAILGRRSNLASDIQSQTAKRQPRHHKTQQK